MSQKSLTEQFHEQIIAVCDALGTERPITEYFFARGISRRWRADFAWPERSLIVEVDGGTGGRKVVGVNGAIGFTVSGHNSVSGYRENRHRDNAAIIMGWTVLRGDQKMVTSGNLCEYVRDFLTHAKRPSLRIVPKTKTYLIPDPE